MIKAIIEILINLYLEYSSKPSHLRDILEDYLNLNGKVLPNNEHLKSAIEWLCRAQDETR